MATLGERFFPRWFLRMGTERFGFMGGTAGNYITQSTRMFSNRTIPILMCRNTTALVGFGAESFPFADLAFQES